MKKNILKNKKYKFQSGVQYAQLDVPPITEDYGDAYQIRTKQALKQSIGSNLGQKGLDIAGAAVGIPGLGGIAQGIGQISNAAFTDSKGNYKSKAAEIANQHLDITGTLGKGLSALTGDKTAAADLWSGSLIGTGLGALGVDNPFGKTTQEKVKEEAQKEEERVRVANMTRNIKGGASTDVQSFIPVAKKGKYKVKTKQPRLIETEGREPIFSPKKPDGTRDLLYYNPNDPTHEEGGVKAVVMPNSYKDDGAKKLKYKTVPADTRDKTPVEKLQTRNTPFSYEYASPERRVKETVLPLIGKSPTLNLKNIEVPQRQVVKNVDEFVGPQNEENIDPREKDYVEYLEPKIPGFPKVNIKEPKRVLKKVPVPLPVVKPKPKPKPVNTKEATYFTYGLYDNNQNGIDDFEEEYNRSSKKMKKFYNKVNLVKIDNRDPYRLTKFQKALGSLKKDSDVYFLDHAGANLFGLPQDQFAKTVGIYTKHLSKGKSNCYMGSCYGGGHTDDKIINKINKQGKNFKNLYSTNKELWLGTDPSDKYQNPEDVFLPNKKDRYVVKNKNGNRSVMAYGAKQVKVNDLNTTAFSQNFSGMPSANAANKFIQPTAGMSQVARQIPDERRQEKIRTPRSHKKENPDTNRIIDPPMLYEMKPPPPRSTFNTKNDFNKGSKKVKVYR